MKNGFVAACLAFVLLPACAPLKTEMVECPSTGCQTASPPDPILDAVLPQVHDRATADLACPPNEIEVSYLGAQSEYAEPGFGPFEAKGCGKQAIYRTVDPGFGGWDVERASLVLPIAK
jgi:hypothetical protein